MCEASDSPGPVVGDIFTRSTSLLDPVHEECELQRLNDPSPAAIHANFVFLVTRRP